MSLEKEKLRLCFNCVREEFLRKRIQHQGLEAECSYCNAVALTFAISELADEFDVALKEHFYQTPTEPDGMEYAMVRESEMDWERKGEPLIEVIEDAAGVDGQIAHDIQEVMRNRHFDFELAKMGEENPFDEEAHYARSPVDVENSHKGWRYFENSLRTQTRYFSKNAQELLSSVFEAIEDQQHLYGNPFVVEAGPGKELAALYRARVFQSDEKLENALKRPDRDLGPPPSLAATNGRMNAHGISVFYGATDPLIAIAEVRPPVGSKTLVGRFEFLRALKLLDVEAMRSVVNQGSIFDRSYIRRLERGEFLKWLSARITMPVMPDDEPFEYLATQAVADFLASNANPPLDGILYRSVQGGSANLNAVLFHKAARVEPLTLPRGATISSQLYFDTRDGYEFWPWVYECLPTSTGQDADNPDRVLPKQSAIGGESDLPDPSDLMSFESDDFDPEQREPTLRLDISSLAIHLIKGASFDTQHFPVHRHRQ